MKNSPLTTVLLGVLVLSALSSVMLCWMYISNARELRNLQAQAMSIQQNRAFITSLATDTLEYSKTHPAIEPVLEAVKLVEPKNAAPKPSAK
jgi:hypothetical protein